MAPTPPDRKWRGGPFGTLAELKTAVLGLRMPVADEMARRLKAWLGIALPHMIGVSGDPERPLWTIAKPKDRSQHPNVNLLDTKASMLSRSRQRLCRTLQDWCAAAGQVERQGGNPWRARRFHRCFDASGQHQTLRSAPKTVSANPARNAPRS
jgi:hypothetical protein